MNGLKRFVQEVHRRSLWQVLGIYLVGGWVVLQAVDTLAGALNLPDWASPLALFLLIVGLPMVLATAFVQEGMRGAPEDVPSDVAATDPAATDPTGVDQPGEPTGGAPAPTASGAEKVFTWRNAISGGVLAFALWGVVATAVLLSGSRPTTGAADAASSADALRSIAVLPFDNLSPDEENAYFADGIHEDVLTQLSKLGDLTVISRTSVLPYRETEMTLSQIADELGVGSILEGSVRRAGDNVRITAQLIDASTDEHLWADNFDRALTTANVFAIQSEIAQRIAEALAATLSPDEENRIARSPTADLEAYDFYLQARTTYQLYTEEGNDEAIRLYREALSRDPEYADAWAGLADAYAQRVQRFGFPLAWADSAEALARRALQIEPELPQAYKALGLAMSSQGRWQDDLRANQRAIELDPNYSEAINNVAVALANTGRYDESLRYMKRAYQLEPTTGFTSTNIALLYAFVGMPGAAEARAQEILRLQPSNTEAVNTLRTLAIARGDAARAQELSQQIREQHPNSHRAVVAVASDAFLGGDFEEALFLTDDVLREFPDSEAATAHHVRILNAVSRMRTGDDAGGRADLEAFRTELLRRHEMRPEDSGIPVELGSIDAELGDPTAALAWFETAYDLGWRIIIGLEMDPMIESLWGMPGWESLLDRIREDLAVQRANIQRDEAAEVGP